MNEAFEKILEKLEELQNNLLSQTEGDAYLQVGVINGVMYSRKIVQEVAEEYNGGWIPCSERLPEEYGDYLVWWTDITRKQYYEIAEYEPNNGWIGEIPQAVKGKYSVIAWQPLPEPYKESD